MGRIFNKTQLVTPPVTPQTTGGGRVFNIRANISGIKLDKLQIPKTWEEIPLGEKIGLVVKEIPKTLYNFLPPSIKELDKPKVGFGEFVSAIPKGTLEFGAQIANVAAQAFGGAGLSAYKKLTGREGRIDLEPLKQRIMPVAQKIGLEKTVEELPSELSSYGVQVKQLTDQGFTDGEAKALVGINAYLGIIPAVVKGLKIKPVTSLGKVLTTKEVPFTETPLGIREGLKIKPEIKPEVKPTGVVEPLVRVERPFVKAIKEGLKITDEDKQFNELLKIHAEKFLEGRETLLLREEPLNKALSKLSNTELKQYSDVTQGFASPIKPSLTLRNAIELWKKVNKETEQDLISRKLLKPEQVENRKWKPIEDITGRTRDELKDFGIEPIYYPYQAESLLKKSDFIGSTGRRTKGGYLKRFTGKMLQEDSYIKDPRIAIPRNRLQVFRDKMNAELVDNIIEQFAEKDKTIINTYRKNSKLAEQMGVEEWKPAGSLRFYPMEKGIGVTKRVESYWIPKQVARELNKMTRPGTLEKVLRETYDPIIDMWRVSVLGMVPRWLYNNLMGNTIQFIAGRGDPLALIYKSPKELLARTKFGEKIGLKPREIPKGVLMKEYAGGEQMGGIKLGSLPKETTQFLRPVENWLNLLEQAKKYPALRIPALATQAIIKGWIALGKPIGYLNKVTENWFRMAMYLTKKDGKFLGMNLEKVAPDVAAVKYVNEFLFDYTKLTRAERATFRRALPFWNWQKNITKFVLTYPVNHPLRALTAQVLLQDYIDYINEINQADDKVRSVLRIKLNAVDREGKPLYLNVKTAIPYSDVFNTIPHNFETFGRFLTSNPISKLIIERACKLNAFTGQPFTQPRELQQFDEFGKPIQPLPTLLRHIGRQFPQIGLTQSIKDTLQYGRVIKRYETGQPKIYRNRIQTEDWLLPILKYFGLSISAVEYNAIKRTVDRKVRKQSIQEKRYQRMVESGLKNLK